MASTSTLAKQPSSHGDSLVNHCRIAQCGLPWDANWPSETRKWTHRRIRIQNSEQIWQCKCRLCQNWMMEALEGRCLLQNRMVNSPRWRVIDCFLSNNSSTSSQPLEKDKLQIKGTRRLSCRSTLAFLGRNAHE